MILTHVVIWGLGTVIENHSLLIKFVVSLIPALITLYSIAIFNLPPRTMDIFVGFYIGAMVSIFFAVLDHMALRSWIQTALFIGAYLYGWVVRRRVRQTAPTHPTLTHHTHTPPTHTNTTFPPHITN
jgi:hypothetical protein